jgi:hypothetical protein
MPLVEGGVRPWTSAPGSARLGLEQYEPVNTKRILYLMPRRKNVPRREAHRELTPQGDLAILEEDGR